MSVSPGLISNVTEAVMEEVKIWQGRSLDEDARSCIRMRCG